MNEFNRLNLILLLPKNNYIKFIIFWGSKQDLIPEVELDLRRSIVLTPFFFIKDQVVTHISIFSQD